MRGWVSYQKLTNTSLHNAVVIGPLNALRYHQNIACTIANNTIYYTIGCDVLGFRTTGSVVDKRKNCLVTAGAMAIRCRQACVVRNRNLRRPETGECVSSSS